MTFDVRIDQKTLEKACELAIEEAVLNLQEKIIEITPRDPKRLPKNPNRAVTGNLKRSIKNKKNSALDYTIGTLQSPVEYGYAQEFGTPYMPARSFIRKGIIDNKKNFEKDLVKFINLALKSL